MSCGVVQRQCAAAPSKTRMPTCFPPAPSSPHVSAAKSDGTEPSKFSAMPEDEKKWLLEAIQSMTVDEAAELSEEFAVTWPAAPRAAAPGPQPRASPLWSI